MNIEEQMNLTLILQRLFSVFCHIGLVHLKFIYTPASNHQMMHCTTVSSKYFKKCLPGTITEENSNSPGQI